MSIIGSSPQSAVIRQLSNNRLEMNDLQRQLASGKKADTYGGLGSERTMSLALRQEMKQTEGFRNTITLANTRVEIMGTAVDHMREHASNTRGQLMIGGFEPMDNGQTLTQAQAKARLSDTVELLNTQVGDRHLFAGAKTDEMPVRPPGEILDGVGGKAGFRQVMDERRQADLGANGLGRLEISSSAPGGIEIAEDAAGSPFGFKLASVSSNLTGTTVTGPAGDPATLDVGFTADPPQDGEQIKLGFDLPDGTQMEVLLTARSAGPAQAGEFVISDDILQTPINFMNALSSLMSEEAKTTLSSASMQAAANDFFTSGGDQAQRVDGPPFDSATALRDATETDTVNWYTGDRSDTPARETSIARVDENSLVAYGARADEQSFSTIVKQLAILSSAVFEGSGEGEYEKYTAMTDRVRDQLAAPEKSQSLDRVIGELAIAQNSLNEADERHISSDKLVTGFLSEIETADINEVATKLLSMQTQLQASYQVTSMLSKLSLVNFL